MINSPVSVFQGNVWKGSATTDYDGNYEIKPLEPGCYNVLFVYKGYDSVMVTDVIVSPNQRTTQNQYMTLLSKGGIQPGVKVIKYRKPLVSDPPQPHILTKEEIEKLPVQGFY